MRARSWSPKDSLFRGDGKSPAIPTPSADASIVRHILYLGGFGRETPYSSTTESPEIARRFASDNGTVWEARVAVAKVHSVRHVSRADLSLQLRGKGRGRATWTSAFEVLQARAFVERWREHLLDFTSLTDKTDPELQLVVGKVFSESNQ